MVSDRYYMADSLCHRNFFSCKAGHYAERLNLQQQPKPKQTILGALIKLGYIYGIFGYDRM